MVSDPVRGQRPTSSRRPSLWIVLGYVVVATTWILASDVVLIGPDSLAVASIAKGLAFVGVTGAVLAMLLRSRDLRIAQERRRLEVSEARYRLVADRSPDLIYRYRLHPTPGWEYLNPAAEALTGYTPSEILADVEIGRSLVHPDDRRILGEVVEGSRSADDSLSIRWVRRDGEVIWTEQRVALVREVDGRPVEVVGVARDVTAARAVEERLRALERAVEASPVGIALLGPEAEGFPVVHVNPAAAALGGRAPAGVASSAMLDLAHLLLPEGWAELVEAFRSGAPFDVQVTVARVDGTHAPVAITGDAIRGADGAISGFVIVATDETEHRARRIAEERLGIILDASPLPITAIDLEGRFVAFNPAAERLFGWRADEVLGRFNPLIPPSGLATFDDRRRRLAAGELIVGDVYPLLTRDGRLLECRLFSAAVRDHTGVIIGMVALWEDLTEQRRVEVERAKLSRAIDQAQEAVVMTTPDGTIEYVNPAFERVTGYARDELLGRNPRILKSGVQDAAFYRRMWRELAAGRPWRGLLVNRRKDGLLYEEEATISPVRDAAGATVAYVAVKRDLSTERELEAGLQAELRDRAAVREAIARMSPGATPEETARSVCEAVAALGDVDGAIVYHVRSIGTEVVPLASTMPARLAIAVGEPVDSGLATFLRERIAEGLSGSIRIDEGQFDPRFRLGETAGSAVVGCPIGGGGAPFALLIAMGRPADPTAWVARRERALSEIATFVAPLLGPPLAARDDVEQARSAIQRVLDERAYRPLFQPVHEIASRRVVGYEALTRFADGTRPDLRFAEAAAVGLGGALEMACARAALEASVSLPDEAWLSLNTSPTVVLSGELARVLGAAGRPIVIELTEHVAIDDYPALRRAIVGLGPGVSLAVDDAGAGYASLRHVLELRPQFVKLDIGLVRGIEDDPARQALVAGMVHFAAETTTLLVAEGIETDAEASTIARLGVPLGQGFLLGRPAPAPGDRSRRRAA